MKPLLLSLLLFLPSAILARELPLHQLRTPPGMAISLAARVPDARQLALAPDGTLFVGSRRAGKVWALRDGDGDGRYEQRWLLQDGLSLPNGVAFHQGDLYIAALNRILRLPQILTRLDDPPDAEQVTDRLPDHAHHGWKYLKAGPDGLLYFNIGAPCNICLPADPRFATLARISPRGGELEIVARGVRNSVGFAWHRDGSLWFSDNGRDYLGDDLPDDELNRLTRVGQHFGFPYWHGTALRDPRYGQEAEAERGPYQAPVHGLGAHVAPLGLTFYDTLRPQLPDSDGDSLFIAEHGSWNRSRKVGYRVVKLQLAADRVLREEVFIHGWLQGERHWGRPVDVLVDRDGSLLISDDYAGAIYRVSATRQ